MCANYQPIKRTNILTFFDIEPELSEYAGEAWPGSLCPIITAENGPESPTWTLACFGLVPHWADSKALHRRTYNARSETVAAKPSFRSAWKARRFALIPMEGFYEPNYESGNAVRWRIHRADDEPFTAAGIWETWREPDSDNILHSFSMLTINAENHPLMARFHGPDDEKRSIVVVPPENRTKWLRADAVGAIALLQAMPADQFAAEAAPKPAKAKKAP